ncbi:MAG TPA: hypothetical protein VJU83_09590 [Burkholderiales bacterium]|nr:hypothetical protein [Burkholderiales bacterium]
MTIDELIAALQAIKAEHGGELRCVSIDNEYARAYDAYPEVVFAKEEKSKWSGRTVFSVVHKDNQSAVKFVTLN